MHRVYHKYLQKEKSTYSQLPLTRPRRDKDPPISSNDGFCLDGRPDRLPFVVDAPSQYWKVARSRQQLVPSACCYQHRQGEALLNAWRIGFCSRTSVTSAESWAQLWLPRQLCFLLADRQKGSPPLHGSYGGAGTPTCSKSSRLLRSCAGARTSGRHLYRPSSTC